jgi:CelD/BcsL family acetyltransferase involved in cellulose biosynthesis
MVRSRVLEGFRDPAIRAGTWERLLTSCAAGSVNLTLEWQRTWWENFGSGHLLLILAERGNTSVALAPCFAAGGMVFNICPEDCLDFLGDISEPEVLDSMLRTARDCTSDFAGFRFYFIPDTSRTGAFLQAAATRLGLVCCDEGDLPSPVLDIGRNPEAAVTATRKKSLVRHERYFRREGCLETLHFREPGDILPHLDEFFDQHVKRRAATPHPSLFNDPAQREYYRYVVREVGPTGWLRFTRLNWNGRAIAFHFGLCYQGRYLFGVPSFAVELARHSPGEVLLRQLLLAAIAEKADMFDFGVGDEQYKYRFATRVARLRTWGLYPPEILRSGEGNGEPVS